jgi:uncharacterized membrane protein (DUF4010 family)
MTQVELFYRFGVALIIGILVGLEREFAGQPDHELFAGVRTFALLALAGCTAALVSNVLASPWPFIALILTVGLLLATAYVMVAAQGNIGLTTEISAIVTVLAGALCYWGYQALAAALAVVTTLLLSLKLEMHAFAHRMTRQDVYASLKFAVISAVILPVLPNRSFGGAPFDVLNPQRIWLMVVFISGISFLGYVLTKLVDTRNGIGLTGFLGGLVSSTAVTLSFAERSKSYTALAKPFALAITIAWSVMFLRVIIEITAINQALLRVAWLPLAAATGVALAYTTYLFLTQSSNEQEQVRLANPFELGPAVKFGLLYAGILVFSRAAELYLGNAGLYFSSLIAGATDVDAITLSVADLSSRGGVDLATASRAIVLATMSNTIVKAGIVFFTGSLDLRRALWPSVVLITVVGIGVAFLT